MLAVFKTERIGDDMAFVIAPHFFSIEIGHEPVAVNGIGDPDPAFYKRRPQPRILVGINNVHREFEHNEQCDEHGKIDAD